MASNPGNTLMVTAPRVQMDNVQGRVDADSERVDPMADYVPDGFKDANEFLDMARQEFTADAAYDRANRDAALDDLRFLGMDQWDPVVRAARERQGRPCLTINVLPQFIGQVVGDRRINETAIRVRPKTSGTIEEADARSGLIKSIEAYSRAERVYDALCEDQVSCGISNARVVLDWAQNDVFEQDIFIRHIPNPLAVIWDRMSVDITGRDARHCFVQDTLPRGVYEDLFPNQPCPTSLGDGMSDQMLAEGWFDRDTVRVTEFWRMVEKQRLVAMYQDGKICDITDVPEAEWREKVFIDQRTGQPLMRQTTRTYAQMHLVTGFAILEKAYELPLDRLPIIKCTGREVRVGEDRVRYGLIRFAKDSQRMKNYWRSVAVESLALAPKAQWIAPAKALKGRERDFREAHMSGDPLLLYNDDAPVAPQRVDPPALPQALYVEANNNQQDIKDTTGLHDASLGIKSNEVSGKAINARKQEGDIATVIYHDNVNSSIQEIGDVVNQLIPIAYDNVRTARVIGPDNKHVLQKFNDPNDDQSIDITDCKYDVSVETGPSFTTQRQEAAESMMQAVQVAPEIMQIAGDLIVKAQDWPGAYEIAERLKKTIPQQLLGEDAEQQQPTPEQIQAQQQQEQAAQQEEAIKQAAIEHEAQMGQLQLAEMQAKVEKAREDARAAKAAADQAEADAKKAAVEALAAPFKERQQMDHADAQLGTSTMTTVHSMALKTKQANQQNRQRPKPAKKGEPK